MLIQIISSTYVRGWEGFSHDIIETDDKTVLDYVLNDLSDNWDCDSEEEFEDLVRENTFGDWNLSNNYCSVEGDEVTISFEEFKPSKDFLKLFSIK